MWTINCSIESVGFFFRKLSTINMTIREFIYISLCMSLYSLEAAINGKRCIIFFDKLGISYHYAFERLISLSTSHSNHHACALHGRLTFAHQMNGRIVTRLRTHLNRLSSLCAPVRFWFGETYSLVDLFDNDLDAVHLKIFFRQAWKPSSDYAVLPVMWSL